MTGVGAAMQTVTDMRKSPMLFHYFIPIVD